MYSFDPVPPKQDQNCTNVFPEGWGITFRMMGTPLPRDGEPLFRGMRAHFPGMAPPAGRIPLVMGGEPRRAGHPLNGGGAPPAAFPRDGCPFPK